MHKFKYLGPVVTNHAILSQYILDVQHSPDVEAEHDGHATASLALLHFARPYLPAMVASRF